MATSTVTLTVGSWPTGQTHTVSPGWQLVQGTAKVNAGDYATGGLPLTWVPLTGADGKNFFPSSGYSSLKPTLAIVYGIAGYVYAYDFATNKLLILVQGAAAGDPLAELGATTMPSGVTGDTITFLAFFTEMG